MKNGDKKKVFVDDKCTCSNIRGCLLNGHSWCLSTQRQFPIFGECTNVWFTCSRCGGEKSFWLHGADHKKFSAILRKALALSK